MRIPWDAQILKEVRTNMVRNLAYGSPPNNLNGCINKITDHQTKPVLVSNWCSSYLLELNLWQKATDLDKEFKLKICLVHFYPL